MQSPENQRWARLTGCMRDREAISGPWEGPRQAGRGMSWMKPEAKHSGGGREAMITREGQVANVAGRGEGLGPVRRLIRSQFPK